MLSIVCGDNGGKGNEGEAWGSKTGRRHVDEGDDGASIAGSVLSGSSFIYRSLSRSSLTVIVTAGDEGGEDDLACSSTYSDEGFGAELRRGACRGAFIPACYNIAANLNSS